MDSEKPTVLATLQHYFASISNTSPPLTTARKILISDATRVIRPSANDVPSFYTMTQTLDILEDRIRQTPGGIAESFVDPEPEVWVYDNLATIFLGSEQSLSGEGLRRGVHIFTLLKRSALDGDGEGEEARWKIAAVATVARTITQDLPPIVKDVNSKVGKAVMEPIHLLLNSLSRQDWDSFAAGFYSDDARGCLWRGSWPPILVNRHSLIERLKGVIATFPQDAAFAEEIHDVEMRVCGAIAVVWTPFVVVVGGEIRSRGVNVFQCMQFDEGWKTVGFVDTSRPASEVEE